MCRVMALLIVACALADLAQAQEVTTSIAAYAPFGIDDLDESLPLSLELRGTVPLSDRFAVEPFVSAGSRSRRPSEAPEGLYGVQVRQRIVALTGDETHAYAMYGAAGYYSRSGFLPPLIGLVGFGLHQRVASHIALRAEVQLVTYLFVPVGARFLAGAALDLGRR